MALFYRLVNRADSRRLIPLLLKKSAQSQTLKTLSSGLIAEKEPKLVSWDLDGKAAESTNFPLPPMSDADQNVWPLIYQEKETLSKNP